MANPGTELATLDFGNLIGGPLVAVITAQSIAARSTADFIKTVGFYPADQKDAVGKDIGNTPVYVEFKYPKEIQPYQPGKTRYKASSITITDGGSGYTATEAPISFPDPDVSGTKATIGPITIGANGKITDIPITNSGDYDSLPQITLNPPNATGSTVKLTVEWEVKAVASQAAVYQDMMILVPAITIYPIPFIKVDIVTIDFNAKISSMETSSESSDTSIAGNLEVKQRWPSGCAKLNVSAAYKKSTASGSSVERTYSMQIHVQASEAEMPAGMEKLLNILEGAMISKPALP